MQHLDHCRADFPDCVREIEHELYVDDLLTGGPTVEEAKVKKALTTEIFQQATFDLHKWHSNVKEPEVDEAMENRNELSYAKQQLGVKSSECGLLGLRWNKSTDKISVSFPADIVQPTKRGILKKVAKIYDPLGLVCPITLQGKLLYRDACEEKCAWDSVLSPRLVQEWKKWERDLPQELSCPGAHREHRTACLWRRKWKGSRGCCVCCRQTENCNQSGPRNSKGKASKARANHSSSRACLQAHGFESSSQRKRHASRIPRNFAAWIVASHCIGYVVQGSTSSLWSIASGRSKSIQR